MAASKLSNDDFDPSKFAAVKLWFHVLEKGFQAGSVVGLALAVPVVAFRKKSFESQLMTKVLAYSSFAGIGVSGALGTAKFVNMDKEGLEDRVYRLHYNEGQNRCDVFSSTGIVLGAAAVALIFQKRALPLQAINIIGGAAAGSALGVFSHVASFRKAPATTLKDM